MRLKRVRICVHLQRIYKRRICDSIFKMRSSNFFQMRCHLWRCFALSCFLRAKNVLIVWHLRLSAHYLSKVIVCPAVTLQRLVPSLRCQFIGNLHASCFFIRLTWFCLSRALNLRAESRALIITTINRVATWSNLASVDASHFSKAVERSFSIRMSKLIACEVRLGSRER